MLARARTHTHTHTHIQTQVHGPVLANARMHAHTYNASAHARIITRYRVQYMAYGAAPTRKNAL
jgi:hypothetical protein